MANRTYCGAGGLAKRGKKKYAGIYTVPQKKYAFLDYIESSGTQYINTGYLLQSDHVSIRTVFSPTQTSNGQTFFGNQSSPNTILLFGSTSLTFYIGSTNGVGSFPVTAGVYYDFQITADSGKLSVMQNGAETSLT